MHLMSLYIIDINLSIKGDSGYQCITLYKYINENKVAH